MAKGLDLVALQANQPMKQVARSVIRSTMQLRRNDPKSAQEPLAVTTEKVMSAYGGVQEISSITGAETQGILARMGAIWTKNGWDYGEQLGAAAFMVDAGVPHGEFGVYMKKSGSGAMDEKQAYTNLLWKATEERAATMGAVRAAIPGDKEFKKWLKNNPAALGNEASRLAHIRKSGNAKDFFTEQFRYANRFSELTLAGVPAKKLADRQAYSVLGLFDETPEEAKADLFRNMEKSSARYKDPADFRNQLKEMYKIDTPAKEFWRAKGMFDEHALMAGRNAQTIGQNSTVNTVASGIGYTGWNSQMYYAKLRGDKKDAARIAGRMQEEAKAGVGSPYTSNRDKAINEANKEYHHPMAEWGRSLPFGLGGASTVVDNLMWHANVWGNQQLLDYNDSAQKAQVKIVNEQHQKNLKGPEQRPQGNFNWKYDCER